MSIQEMNSVVSAANRHSCESRNLSLSKSKIVVIEDNFAGEIDLSVAHNAIEE